MARYLGKVPSGGPTCPFERAFTTYGGSHPGPPFTCDPECAADGMSTAAQEMNGDLAGSWLWEAELA